MIRINYLIGLPLCMMAVCLPLAANAKTVEERQARAAELVAAMGGPEAARSAWLERWAIPERREKLAEQLAALATEELVLTSTDFSRRSDRAFVSGAHGSVRLDLIPAVSDSERIDSIFAFPWPAEYDREIAILNLTTDSALTAEIDRRVRFSVDKDDFSGAVLVIRDGKPIYAEAFGMANREHSVSNTLDTRFHLGSMDKMFTAVAIGQLIEAGQLSLDTKLVEVLPDYPNRDAAQSITVRHLLTHSAGLGGWFDRAAYDRDARYERMSEWLPVFAAEPLIFRPGERSSYSNEGFVVLGAMIEAVTGRSWFEYVETEIFKPLGMTNTSYPALDEVLPNRAVGYIISSENAFEREPRKANWIRLGYRGGSLGGGYSTVGDMTRFLLALRGGKLLSDQLTGLLTSDDNSALSNYAFGFEIETSHGRSIRGHSGGGPGSGINGDAKLVWETGDAYAVLGNYDAPFAQELGDDIAALLASTP